MTRLTFLAASAGAFAIAACGGNEAPAEAQSDAAAPQAPAAESETMAEPAAAPASEPADGEADAVADTLADVAPGAYALDRNHAMLGFYVGHANDISKYRVGFADYDAELTFDPEDPEASGLSVTINPAELIVDYVGDYQANHPESEFESWHDDLAFNDRWLNADEHPQITFTSTDITRTGPNTGEVTGDLTFLGQTEPVTLDVTYNGLANPPWNAEQDIIGFTASTRLTRSQWGMDALIPWVGDEVTVTFSGEFQQVMDDSEE